MEVATTRRASAARTDGSRKVPTLDGDTGRRGFCTVCHCFASDAHIQSWRHQRNVRYLHDLAIESGMAEPAPLPPPHYGDPQFYYWTHDFGGQHFCKLCCTYAVEEHVRSEEHVTRAGNPEEFLAYADAWLRSRGLLAEATTAMPQQPALANLPDEEASSPWATRPPPPRPLPEQGMSQTPPEAHSPWVTRPPPPPPPGPPPPGQGMSQTPPRT